MKKSFLCDIIGDYFSYRVKSDTSKYDLKVYGHFMSEHEGYIDSSDSYQNITLICSKMNLFEKKKS